MSSDKSRRHQGAHAKKGYTCTGCGMIVHGNGARASHQAMHERRGEVVRMRHFRPGDKPEDGHSSLVCGVDGYVCRLCRGLES